MCLISHPVFLCFCTQSGGGICVSFNVTYIPNRYICFVVFGLQICWYSVETKLVCFYICLEFRVLTVSFSNNNA